MVLVRSELASKVKVIFFLDDEYTLDLWESYGAIFITFYSVRVFQWEISTNAGTMTGFSDKYVRVRRQIQVDEWSEILPTASGSYVIFKG